GCRYPGNVPQRGQPVHRILRKRAARRTILGYDARFHTARQRRGTMQNIDLICVGKLNASYFAEGVAEYQKRLGGFCRFRILELPEAPLPDKNVNQAQIDKALEKEGKAILAAVRKG